LLHVLENRRVFVKRNAKFPLIAVADCPILLLQPDEVRTMPVKEVQPLAKKEEEVKIIDTIKKYAGDDCEITIEYIDRFEPLENGKRRFIMSK